MFQATQASWLFASTVDLNLGWTTGPPKTDPATIQAVGDFERKCDAKIIFFLFFVFVFYVNNIYYNICSKSKKSSSRELMLFTMHNRQLGDQNAKITGHHPLFFVLCVRFR